MHIIYCINDNIISSKISPALLITLFWVLFVLIFFLFLRRGGEEVGVYYFLLKKRYNVKHYVYEIKNLMCLHMIT